MTMNYTCLGRNDDMRERRYKVLTFYLKGASPQETADYTGLPIKQVYNDLMYLRTTPLNDLPMDMVRDFGKSFYEMKITELERRLKKVEGNPPVWLGVQKLIKDYKDASLKLCGALTERIEHGDQKIIIDIRRNNNANDEIDLDTD